MSGLMFGLLAALLAGTGSREQLLVAAQVVRHGRGIAALLAIIAATVATCGLAAVLGDAAFELEPRARTVLTGLCLILAALALGWRSGRAIADPAALPVPQPLGFLAVLLALQINGPLSLAVAAIAALGQGVGPSTIGGVLGAMLPLLAAWVLCEGLARLPMARLRAGAAVILAAVGLVTLWPTVEVILRA